MLSSDDDGDGDDESSDDERSDTADLGILQDHRHVKSLGYYAPTPRKGDPECGRYTQCLLEAQDMWKAANAQPIQFEDKGRDPLRETEIWVTHNSGCAKEDSIDSLECLIIDGDAEAMKDWVTFHKDDHRRDGYKQRFFQCLCRQLGMEVEDEDQTQLR